ncbi:hypothetical protein FRC03_011116 [Tulasnella sp. 419]|nr:hypothetical protein FRC03_011116 [Tulasnella sp. 419]
MFRVQPHFQGSLRCDVNVSVNRIGEPFGTRCEIKNLNTIKGLQVAIASEVLRHIDLLSKNIPVSQETRGFDEDTGQTFKLRSKEDAPEYRYMPDPNLPPLILTEAYIDRIRSSMPELPLQTSSRLQSQYGLNPRDTEVLLAMNAGSDVPFDGEPAVGSAVQYFEEASKERDPKAVVNWITHDLLGSLSHRNEAFSADAISVERFGELIDLVRKGTITGTSGKTLLRHLLTTRSTEPLETLIDTLGLRAMDSSSLSDYCQKAIADLPREAGAVRAGNDKVLMKLVGYVMKLSKGTADAQATRAMLKDSLNPEKSP